MHFSITTFRGSLLRLLALLILLITAVPCLAADARSTTGPEPDLWALEFGVPDLEQAVAFYTTALGFDVLQAEPTATWTLLGNGDARLALTLSDLPIAPGGGARAYANFSVGSLDIASRAVTGAGGHVEEPFESPVGMAARFVDPVGHPGYLIDHPWDEMAPEAKPAVFNVALNVGDVETSEDFYTALGFTVSNRDYLPETLVFKPQGSAQLILHPLAEGDAGPGGESGALLLDVDPSPALAALKRLTHGARIDRTTPASSSSLGSTVEIRDPSGILLKLARRSASEAPVAASPQRGAQKLSPQRGAQKQLAAEQAAAAFERLKSLAGHWQAKSTRGWDEPVRYEVVAGGSVVVESNSFKDAPQNKMFTMFHLDGERLLATHYCSSGNQPRLIASGVSDDGSELTFTYLDATGLPSRDHGHMDQAVFRFLENDRFSSRWTWYQKGAEQWLEEIEHRRLQDEPVRQAAASP